VIPLRSSEDAIPDNVNVDGEGPVQATAPVRPPPHRGVKTGPASPRLTRGGPAFEVRTKEKTKVVESIGIEIMERFTGMAGIIFCSTKNNCDVVSKQLCREQSIAARPYRSGLTPAVRAETKHEWTNGLCRVYGLYIIIRYRRALKGITRKAAARGAMGRRRIVSYITRTLTAFGCPRSNKKEEGVK